MTPSELVEYEKNLEIKQIDTNIINDDILIKEN
jgi:hypothetical protein